MHIFDELKERGLIFQTTDEEALRRACLLYTSSFLLHNYSYKLSQPHSPVEKQDCESYKQDYRS